VDVRIVPSAARTLRDIRPGAALLGGGQSVVREFLEAHPDVGWRWFHLMSSGPDHITGWRILDHVPLVTCSRGVNARSMAEWVLAVLLHFQRDLDLYTRAQWDPEARSARWERRWARELSGQHMVVWGAGSVAGQLAPLARSLGLRLTGISRSGDPVAGFDAVISADRVDEALASADVLVVLLPLSPATREIVSAERLARLPEGSLLIAASRGGVVDETAALRGVREGHLRGAAFDVFETEPLPDDAPHWREPGVLVTPHVAGSTDRFMEHAAEIVEQVWEAAFRRGQGASLDAEDVLGRYRVAGRRGASPIGFD
jgi:D-2-hydroxyacid dehydrogenase (NADP+)